MFFASFQYYYRCCPFLICVFVVTNFKIGTLTCFPLFIVKQ
ncbi:hypothetical protein Leryth_008852 [Lithospermum erythrorhizon]|nr:hypothetical protein Leryth_008852 [Lithospermum erythrorhizon]